MRATRPGRGVPSTSMSRASSGRDECRPWWFPARGNAVSEGPDTPQLPEPSNATDTDGSGIFTVRVSHVRDLVSFVTERYPKRPAARFGTAQFIPARR